MDTDSSTADKRQATVFGGIWKILCFFIFDIFFGFRFFV